MKKLISALLLLAYSSASSAIVVDCAGRVTTLTLGVGGNDGLVIMSLANGPQYQYLCSVTTAYNGTSPAACRQMYQTLVLAKISGATMMFRFDGYSSCTAIPAWAPAPITSGWNTVLD